ncbi:tRNA A-37 threonylcarbamoyl transferase component Bud32 [Pullulanibacillus pueri]|uniref:Aminoglycoside phosphotransferase n=1 Tax=Pullulanibacillus pueri TaxID=1437324 RepID=A0A8J2ZT99_9BACL|nr:tRNA A-37 threonylcarbamoyl transferase component Bud32 [Pullulanibacillus pueri]GGH77229.1 aminoglycoside phosphotransferase [Pullulanibacillus pueri]
MRTIHLGDPIAKGNTAKIYLYDHKIIKLFNDDLPDTEASYEANKQQYAYSCGLPVPKILDVTKIDGKQAIIMECIEGRTLGELIMENKERTDHYLTLSVEVQQQIHKIRADSFEPMKEKLRRQIESALMLSQRQQSFLLKRLESMTVGNHLCHGDFHLFNLIMSENKVIIIDWVDASAGNPCADIYRTYLLYLQFSGELAERYLQMCCKMNGLPRAAFLEWAPILAGARLSENVSSENSERLIAIVNQYCD